MQQQGARVSNFSPFGSAAIMLDQSALVVNRRYPTFVDTIAKCGGMARVISFIIFTVMSLHHQVTLEQYLLNEALLQSERTQALQESAKKDEDSVRPVSTKII